MKSRIISLGVCMSLLLGFTFASFGQTVMIVHPESPAGKVTRAEAANLFLGKTTQWSGGLKALPVDQKKASHAGKAFLDKIVKMTETEFKNYWVEKMLTGEAEPPKALASNEEIVQFVKANKGAIGYVDSATPREGVKVLPIDGANEW